MKLLTPKADYIISKEIAMYKILIVLVSVFAGLLAFFYANQRFAEVLSDTSLGGFIFFASILYGCCILSSLAYSPQGLKTLSKKDSQECMQLIDDIYNTTTRCNIFAFLFFIVWNYGLIFVAENQMLNATIIFVITFLFSVSIFYLNRIVQYAIYIIKQIALYGREEA